MNYFLKEIKNWFQKKEMSAIVEAGEDKGVVDFYHQLYVLTSHSEYIDDIPTVQYFFSENYLKQHDISQGDIPDLKKKIIFYINLLKSKEYLEIIPRLTVISNRIQVVDHLLINKEKMPLSPDELMTQALNETVSHAKTLLSSSYNINDEFIFKMIHNKNHLFILYLPYYFLMEKIRTGVDPVFNLNNYMTIRRDKQAFLDRVYRELIERKILVCDSTTPDLERLNSYYRFAWIKPTMDNPGFIQHYYYIFRILMKDYLLNSQSKFYYSSLKNEKINILIENLDEDFFRVSPDRINMIVRNFLQHNQDTLLKDSKTIKEHPEFRYVRNIAVELILQGSTVKDLEHAEELRLTKGGHVQGKDQFSFYEIMVRYRDRANDVLACQVRKLEDLKEVLKNPANHEMFFSNSGEFPDSIHSFSSLLKKYMKYKRHFMAIFPDLGNIKKENDQLKLILNSFKRIGLLVHVSLPAEECKETGHESDWYAEAFFWNNRQEKEKAIEHFRDEYKFSKNESWKKIHDEWLHCLPHDLKWANSRASGQRKKERILV